MRNKVFCAVTLLLALTLLLTGPAFAAGNDPQAPQGPQVPLVGMDSPRVIPGSYIVVFKPGSAADAVDKAVADAHDASDRAKAPMAVAFRYDAALQGFAAKLPAQAVEALRHNPNVDYIEADQVVTIDTTQSPATWGIDRVDQRGLPLSNSYTYNYTGAGVTAYIIDTGILTSHTDFGGRASVAYDAVGDGRNGQDCNGHGTHVAGTVGGKTYGVAKGVTLKAVRVLNCSGSGSTSGVIAGVNWVTSHHASLSVANMSLGGSVSSSLDTAVNNSINAGVVYAIAAGNSSANACSHYGGRHHLYRRTCLLLQLRLVPGSIRAGLVGQVRLVFQHHRHQHPQRHVDGNPARDWRGRARPAALSLLQPRLGAQRHR
jgi:subtilisin family serine protease